MVGRPHGVSQQKCSKTPPGKVLVSANLNLPHHRYHPNQGLAIEQMTVCCGCSGDNRVQPQVLIKWVILLYCVNKMGNIEI
jgi:hypothetical protein